MKILAATPTKQYNHAVYIAELTSGELRAVLLLRTFSRVTVTDKDGAVKEKDLHELVAGDVIDNEFFKEQAELIEQWNAQQKEIKSAMSRARAAMTKLSNLLPVKE